MNEKTNKDPRYDIDRLYLTGSERGRGLANLEDRVNMSIQ